MSSAVSPAEVVASPGASPERHLRIVPAPTFPVGPINPRRRRSREADGQAELPLTFDLPSGLPAVPEIPPRLQVVVDADHDEDFAAVITPRTALPPAGPWTARLAQAIAEVVAGDRPLQQLVRWTSHDVYLALQSQVPSVPRPRLGPGRARTVVRHVRVTEPADGVIEASAVVSGAGRPCALVLRLEGLDGRWVCTVAERITAGGYTS